MQRILIALFMLTMSFGAAKAQGLQNIQIKEDPAISNLMSQYVEGNKQRPYIIG